MWKRLASLVLKFRLALLIILFVITGVLAYFASQVQLSYDFIKAVPTGNEKYQQYLSFKNEFGEDGNMMVIGVQTDKFFQQDFFNDYYKLMRQIKQVHYVEDILSVPTAVNLVKNPETHRLQAKRIFTSAPANQQQLDSLKSTFLSLPFYQKLLYNPDTHAYLMAVHINKNILNRAGRTKVIGAIEDLVHAFEKKQHVNMHLSGLPLIRTVVASKVAHELKFFLIASFILTALILFLFFRSFGTVLMSMIVVATGVIWSLATIVLLGYKLTILTGLIPPLIVVIGIPNCVYFLNKYHAEYSSHRDKTKALVKMVQRMGIVTLFTNLTAAIGFGVFFFTQSAILKEFGIVAGVNIMMLFVISFIFLPATLSFLPPPKERHTNYLDSPVLQAILSFLQKLVFEYRKWVYAFTVLIVIAAFAGMMQLKAVGHIVDDIPQSDVVYKDLKFFENNFSGVMPLEILIDTKHKYGILRLSTLNKIDQLSKLIESKPAFAKPLSIVNGIKFARQAYYNGDSNMYTVPNQFDMAFLAPYMRMGGNKGDTTTSTFSKLVSSFMDSTRQVARVSVNMADVGSAKLPVLLDSLRPKVNEIFDTAHYNVIFTGTSVIFLEGTRFIINGLTDSIILAFVLIIFCMLYLFRSWRILIISLVPNIIPLIFTAGVMGWVGVPLKPSTVLVFSVALGISIDVAIRFLVNFKQELPHHDYDITATVKQTIHDTGLSIIYTGLILFAGFMIFSFSEFGGTKALGWLTSLTLIISMLTNLTILPALLLWMEKALSKADLKKQTNVVLAEEEDSEEFKS